MKKKNSSQPLDRAFWAHFATQIWEQKPLSLQKVQSPLVEMDHLEVFRLLVLYANHCRKTKNAEGFKLFLEGERVHESEVLPMLPRQSDKTLLGYHKRMNAIFEDYCLVCDELLRVNLRKQALLSTFTNELYQHVGFPNRFAEMGLYLGNYRRTPFGVHVDACGVFSFPVVGEKKFRLWTPEFVRKNPGLVRAHQYGKYKSKSLVLKASPGDMTYWPSSSWHIAESDGSFTATWSLGIWVDRPHTQMVQQTVASLISQRLEAPANQTMTPFTRLHELNGEVQDLPKLTRQSLKTLQGLQPKEFEFALLRDWMVHISKEGFKTRPLVESKIRLRRQTVLRRGPSPLLWLQDQKGQRLFVCFAGTLVHFSNRNRGILKLIKDLNAGQACLLGPSLQDSSSTQTLKNLQTLADAGAFETV